LQKVQGELILVSGVCVYV